MVNDPQSKATVFTCPICLEEKQVLGATTSSDEDNNIKTPDINAVDQDGNPIFELASCNHQFCAACLRNYVRSKLMDGEVNIPCCHFKLSSKEEDFQPCNSTMEESDISRLIHMDIPEQLLKADDGCCEEEGSNCVKANMFTCPICLDEKQVLGNTPNAVDQDGNPIFELTSCNHQFCAACLRDYVRSKVMDGEFDIPCCHFKLSPMEEDFQPCKSTIRESDVTRLIDMDLSEQLPNTGDLCRKENGSRRVLPIPTENDEDENAGGGGLWTKYQKLKFDEFHGKDAVRRCPKCDEARVFDEESMKEYRTKFLTQNNEAPTSADGTDASTGTMHRFERAFSILRQRQPPNAKNEVVGSSSPRPEEGVHGPEKEAVAKGDAQPLAVEGPSSGDAGGHVESTHSEKNAINAGATAGVAGQTGSDVESNAGSLESNTSDSRAGPMQGIADDSPSLVKSSTPVVTCHTCSEEFCYFHSNAHSGKSCIEYHEKSKELERCNMEYATRILHAKPCPTCGISVSKDGGCNQIKCRSCGTCFCWLCSEIVDDGAFPEHFRWWNLQGCANMQLDENNEPMRCTKWGAKLLSVVQIIVLGPPAVVLSLVSMILCPCLVPGCGRTNRERIVNSISFWGSVMSSLMLLPFTCLGMLLVSAVYLFLACMSCLLKMITSWVGRQNRTPSNPQNSQEGRNATTSRTVDVGNSGDAAPSQQQQQQLIRELESIFESI